MLEWNSKRELLANVWKYLCRCMFCVKNWWRDDRTGSKCCQECEWSSSAETSRIWSGQWTIITMPLCQRTACSPRKWDGYSEVSVCWTQEEIGPFEVAAFVKAEANIISRCNLYHVQKMLGTTYVDYLCPLSPCRLMQACEILSSYFACLFNL